MTTKRRETTKKQRDYRCKTKRLQREIKWLQRIRKQLQGNKKYYKQKLQMPNECTESGFSTICPSINSDYRLSPPSVVRLCNVVFTALCGKSVWQLRPQNDLHGGSHQCSSDLCTGLLFVRVLILKYHCGVYEAPNGLRPKYISVHFLQLGYEPSSALRTEPGEAEFSYRTSDILKNTLYSFKLSSMQKQSGQSLNSSVLCLLMSREEAESLTELRARAFGGGTPYLWLIPSLICFSSLLPPPSLLLARCRFDLFPTWLHEDKCVNVRSLTMEHYCFCPVSATVAIRSCALLEKLIKTMAGAPPEHTPGRQQQQQQTLLPFQIRLFTFQGRTRCSSSCLGFWAFKHKGTRIKYLSRLYVCLSKKFFRRQTEHQKSLSAAEGNVRERTRQAYAARYRVCFLCVFVPFIRWKLASDLSTYVILLSGRRGFPHSHTLHHIAHGEHVTVHRVCCFRCGNT